MLDILRSNTRSFIIYLLFSIIIIVFVFTFNTITPGEACGSSGPATLGADFAQVEGTTVDASLFNMADAVTIDPPSPTANDFKALQRRYAYYSTRFPQLGVPMAFADFTPDPQRISPVKADKVMYDLIETLLVAGEARRAGLSVSDDELSERLLADDGWFDPKTGEFLRDRYESFVRYQLGTSPTRFESFLRDEMLREKLISVVVAGVGVSDAELAFHRKASGEKVDLELVVVDAAATAPLVQVEPEALAAWLAKNQDAVSRYYDEHSSDYNKEERVVVRGLQVKATNRAIVERETDETKKAELQKEREDARAKAEAALTELKAAEAPAAPEAPAAAEAPAAEEPAAEEAAVPPAEDGAERVAKAEAAPVEGAVTTEAFEAAVTAHSDHAATKEAGGLFPEPRTRAEMGRWPFGSEAADAVFALQPGQVTGVIEVDSGFWVLRLERRLPAESRGLADARMEIAEKLYRQEKAAETQKAIADEVLAAAKKDPTQALEEAAQAVNQAHGLSEESTEGLSARATGLFSRLPSGAIGAAAEFGQVPGLGAAEELARAAFAAKEGQPVLDRVFSVEDGKKLVVARVAGHEEASDEDADDVRGQLLREKQKLFYRGWYDDLLRQATEEGDVEFTEAWRDRVKQDLDAFRESGGVLPGAEGVPAVPVEGAEGAAAPAPEAPAAAPAAAE
ncbi:MAG: SurA N-terminal domain-containing protein [Deltaproteobacteria bacterium]|nr:SurA N-terminal domain-containing protein [Deltaproteobacteria bacterium]MCB9788180.1 SurA N-terminal domain-containing protein [Deltaproteobacteria bacterium]